MVSTTPFRNAQQRIRASLRAAPGIMVAVLAVGMNAADARAEGLEPSAAAPARDSTFKQDVREVASAYESMRERMYRDGVGALLSGAKSPNTYGQTASWGARAITPGVIDYTKPYRPGSK